LHLVNYSIIRCSRTSSIVRFSALYLSVIWKTIHGWERIEVLATLSAVVVGKRGLSLVLSELLYTSTSVDHAWSLFWSATLSITKVETGDIDRRCEVWIVMPQSEVRLRIMASVKITQLHTLLPWCRVTAPHLRRLHRLSPSFLSTAICCKSSMITDLHIPRRANLSQWIKIL